MASIQSNPPNFQNTSNPEAKKTALNSLTFKPTSLNTNNRNESIISNNSVSEPEKPKISFLSILDSEENKLWTDKYEVCKFSNLVTDPQLNREAAQWLKSWRPTVFGPKEKVSMYFDKKAPLEVGKGLLLLTGPPGCGKTTLARVTALLNGYDYKEINCALIESGKDLLEMFKSSLNIRTVSSKPQILIIDQIETLDKPTIRGIAGFISSKTLKRPTIAITNDLYASNLLPLRSISQILYCKVLTADCLLTRIKEICENERIFVPDTHMQMLIKECNYDIRACLNFLQLVGSSRSGNQLNVTDINLGNVKQVTHSIFDIWRMIFTEPNCKNLKRNVLNYGDMDLVNIGIFENYPNAKFTDYTLDKTTELLDSLCFNDIISRRIHEYQEFELYPYQSYPSQIANKFCAANKHIELQFPINSKQLDRNVIETQDALSMLRPHDLNHKNKVILMEDVYSYMGEILKTRNMGFVKEVLLELGFEINKADIAPEIKRIVRMPKDFNISFEWREEKKAPQEKGLVRLASQKRKRDCTNGCIFVYHDGLTNAVKRKVKLGDLM